MSLTRLKEFLDENNVKYVTISHSLAYTAQGIAALTHTPGQELAKTVMLRIDGKLAMAIVPASAHVGLTLLKTAVGAKTVDLAAEADFKNSFPDCETGAMPPFGNLYDIPVFADESLSRDPEIAFNAGTHRELMRLAWNDFQTLVNPRLIRIAVGRAAESAA
jgi:Ala-tRNA(Pro) deacylase